MRQKSRTARRRASTSVDVGRLSRAVQRPGIDPRVWVCRGWVTAYNVDKDNGSFVDVDLQTGENETARIGEGFAGVGYGDHNPIAVGDELLLVAPMGVPDAGLVAVARLYCASDPPPAEAANNPGDALRHFPSGVNFRIVHEGAGAFSVAIADEGKIYFGSEEAAEAFVLGTTYRSAEDTMLSSIQTALTSLHTTLLGLASGLGTAGNDPTFQGLASAAAAGLVTAATAASGGAVAPQNAAAAISTFKSEASSYLSTHIMGQK